MALPIFRPVPHYPAQTGAVENGAYKKISASSYHPGSACNPITEMWYLRHVGFLGAVSAAVKDLPAMSLAEGKGTEDFATFILEFVGRNDPMFQKLLEHKWEKYVDDIAKNFDVKCRSRFSTLERLRLNLGSKELFLLMPQ